LYLKFGVFVGEILPYCFAFNLIYLKKKDKKRAFLRKLAHNLDPIVRIGKDGIDENVLNSIAEVVKKRELIKVKILQNSSVEFNREMGDEIQAACGQLKIQHHCHWCI